MNFRDISIVALFVLGIGVIGCADKKRDEDTTSRVENNTLSTVDENKSTTTDPVNLNPVKLGSYDTAGNSSDVVLSSDGYRAYIADGTNGLVIVDINDSSNPTKIGSYNTDGNSHGVTLSSDGTKAYIADGKNGLVIIGGIK